MKGHKNDYQNALNIRVDSELYRELRNYSEKRGIPISETVRRSCRLFLYQQGQKEVKK